MGNYLSVADIKQRKLDAELLRLTAEAGETAINETVLSSYIDDAEAEMNLILMSGGYTVPVTTGGAIIASILKRIAYDILIHRMYKATYDDYPDNSETKQLYIDYNRSRDLLYKISKGELKLKGVAIADTATAPILTNNRLADRKMTDSELNPSRYDTFIISND